MEKLGAGAWEQTRATCVNCRRLIAGGAATRPAGQGSFLAASRWGDLNTRFPAGSGWTLIEGGGNTTSPRAASSDEEVSTEQCAVRLDPVSAGKNSR